MKILFYLRIVVMGGAEHYLIRLLPELKKRNIEVGFFCTRQSDNHQIINDFINHFEPHNIPVHVCDSSSVLSLKAARMLAKTVSKERYTILSAHLMHAEIICAFSKMVFRPPCKLVVTKHGYLQGFMDVYGLDPTKINKLKPSYQVEKFVQNFVEKNFAVSKGLLEFYTRSGICKSSKMELIYYGLDADFCNQAYTATRYSDNQVVIVARLKKFKGHRLLITAINILHKEIPDLKLVIVGDGEERDNLVSMVNQYQLNSRIIFTGHIDNVSAYIKDADIVIAPSLSEPFGLVVLEAYSCSKPVIAFDVTAFNENIVDNETGYLVKPYDIELLAGRIKWLLQNKALARQMGQKGKDLLLEKFTMATCVENTIEFFKRI
ncbi:MAG: glycosyltransferase family 4 protein [Ferruginibacter sp.]